MGGVAQISASITAPGVIHQVGTFMRMIFGELDGTRSRRGEDFLALCLKAGFDATLSEQILTDLWMKFILLASNAGMMALSRQPIGKLRDDPDMRSDLSGGLSGSHRCRPRPRHRAAGRRARADSRTDQTRFHRP